MHVITAELEASTMRLCLIKTRIFDGYVKVAGDETVERGDNTFDFISHKKRVLDEEVIRAGAAFRVEVSRAMMDAGVHTEMGTIVNERGYEEVRRLEREFIDRAAEIQEAQTKSLREGEADVTLAKCEVSLIVLKVVAEEEAADQTDEFFQDAVEQKLRDEVGEINKTVKHIRELVAVGNAPRAKRQTSIIERCLRSLDRRGWRDEQLAPLREDLGRVREVLAKRSTLVAEKLAALDEIELMKGVEARTATVVRMPQAA